MQCFQCGQWLSMIVDVTASEVGLLLTASRQYIKFMTTASCLAYLKSYLHMTPQTVAYLKGFGDEY